jgi:hypothetical protein
MVRAGEEMAMAARRAQAVYMAEVAANRAVNEALAEGLTAAEAIAAEAIAAKAVAGEAVAAEAVAAGRPVINMAGGAESSAAIRARVLGNIAENQAATQNISRGLTTMDLRAATTIAAREVDALGARAFTPRQLAAMQRNPNLQSPFRGNRIDVRTRSYVEQDPFLRNLQSNYTRGPDFRDLRTGDWWDITTPAQWPAHVQKYGPGGTLLPTR